MRVPKIRTEKNRTSFYENFLDGVFVLESSGSCGRGQLLQPVIATELAVSSWDINGNFANILLYRGHRVSEPRNITTTVTVIFRDEKSLASIHVVLQVDHSGNNFRIEESSELLPESISHRGLIYPKISAAFILYHEFIRRVNFVQ